MTPIEQIYNWNREAGLLDKPYDDFLESSFQVEEALEKFNSLHVVAEAINREHFNACKSDTPKDVARGIVSLAQAEVYDTNGEGTGEPETLSDVDRLDKACDAVVYAVGSMAKLGLNPIQINKALSAVMESNMAKLKCPKDECGKLTKPADFDELYAPEPRLQALLDERNK